jgi:hypothetical protein
MDEVGIFYEHLVYFTDICDILRRFGIFGGNLVYFPRFGMLHQENSGNPGDVCKNSFAQVFYPTNIYKRKTSF